MTKKDGTVRAVALLGLLGVAAPAAAGAQTDYYNTDRSRPARIEDAHPTELYAFELKVAPLRIEQEEDGGFSRWSLLPEAAYGILPRTNLEVGLPIAALGEGRTGISGVEVSLFHNLNVESRTLPALAVRGDLELPVGSLGPERVIPSLTGIATRTFPAVRFHVNGRYTFGPAEEETEDAVHSEGRWLAGIAADRVFPLQALLLIAEVYAMQPMTEGEAVRWTGGAGIRYQINPFLAVDAGLGRTFTADPGWHLTVGSALHVGVRSLVRGGR